jgi:protein-S-isoprenylcysteine O-methyltransferase Ste14
VNLTPSGITKTRAWDVAVRALGTSCFGFLAALVLASIITASRGHGASVSALGATAALVAQACLFVLLLVEASLILLRPPAVAKSVGIQPRVSAFLGTWLMGLIVLFPVRSNLPPIWLAAAGVLGILSNLLVFLALRHLGRSFSVMAEARGLVVSGPYRVVRHPIYLAEELGLVSAVITHFSPEALVLLAVQFGFQIVRAGNEERVLTRAFPAYAAYRERVPRLVPGARWLVRTGLAKRIARARAWPVS